MSAPVYVSPFLGAGADWLCLLSPDLVPPVSWVGGKRRLAVAPVPALEFRIPLVDSPNGRALLAFLRGVKAQ